MPDKFAETAVIGKRHFCFAPFRGLRRLVGKKRSTLTEEAFNREENSR
jgi:hypothetical protein